MLEELVQRILDAVRSGRSVVLEAYPGFGKTRLAALLLHNVQRGVVVVHTHNEILETFRFLPSKTGVAYGYGRHSICYKLSSFSYETCRAYRLLGKCSERFDHRHVAWLAAAIRRPEEIREYEKRHNVCLYRALRMLCVKSKKAVVTYDYVVHNPSVLDDRDVVVMDEAHHLLKYVNDMVLRLDAATIELLANELKKNPETRQLAYALRSIYRRSSSIHEFVDRLNSVLSSLPLPDNEIVRLLDRVVEAYCSRRYLQRNGEMLLLVEPLPKIARMRNKVMLGAYLPPFFISQNAVKISIPCGEPRIDVLIDDSISTRYDQRSEELYVELAKKVEQYVASDVGNLVAFPSYEVMNFVVRHLSDGIRRRILTPEEAIELREIPSGAIVIDVAGGRISEGVNLLNVGNVIVVGMPYPAPTPELDLLSRIYGFDNVYTYIAMLRTLQTIGRIRGRGRAILVDERFARYRDRFPSWVRVA